MENIDLSRFIERYLDNRMQKSERIWFEKELEGNISLQKELELRRRIDLHASNTEAVKLREQLIKAESRHRKKSRMQKGVSKANLNYVAVFAGLLVVSSLLFFSGNRLDIDNYTSNALDNYVPVTVQRSGNELSVDLMAEGMELYNEGKYEMAIEKFSTLIKGDEPSVKGTFFNGMANMKIEEYHNAIESFNTVVDDNDNMFIEDANYFMGLCHVKLGHYNSAKTVFEGIIDSRGRYWKEARKILKNID